MNTLVKPSPRPATLPRFFDLPGCSACLRRRQTLSVVRPTMFVSSTFRCGGVRVGGLLSRLRAGRLALTIASLIVALSTTRSWADSVGALANLTGASTSTCQSLLTNLTGGDPSTLLDGLTPGEAAQLLEVVAHRADLTPARGPTTVR